MLWPNSRSLKPDVERAVLDLAAGLRRHDVAVGLDGVRDALRCLTVIDVSDREVVRSALAATLLDAQSQRALFDQLFDRHLPPSVHDADQPGRSEPREPDTGGSQRAEPRVDAGHGTETTGIAGAAAEARHSGVLLLDRGDHTPPSAVGALATGTGPDQDAPATGDRRVPRPRTDAGFGHIELMDLPDDGVELSRILRRLAPTLATQPAFRPRGGRTGRVDIRRTLRRSLSTGGVPADPGLRTKRRYRPDLLLLCDVSGSMRSAARFTLLMSHTFQRSFSSVKTLGFVDAAVDLTSSLAEPDVGRGLTRALNQLTAEPLGPSTDYGTMFESVLERHAGLFGPRTIVVVLGDARTNYRPLNTAALTLLRRRCRRLVWLNPEPRNFWDTGDSAAASYAAHCDRMVECRTVEQTAAAFTQLTVL